MELNKNEKRRQNQKWVDSLAVLFQCKNTKIYLADKKKKSAEKINQFVKILFQQKHFGRQLCNSHCLKKVLERAEDRKLEKKIPAIKSATAIFLKMKVEISREKVSNSRDQSNRPILKCV